VTLLRNPCQEAQETYKRLVDGYSGSLEIPRKPTLLETCLKKSWDLLLQAVVTDCILPGRFWLKLCLFPLTRPFLGKDILSTATAVLVSLVYDSEPGEAKDPRYLAYAESYARTNGESFEFNN
jgi:hypothetical protein